MPRTMIELPRSEYLLNYDGRWYIGTPGAIEALDMECTACDGTGVQHRTKRTPCGTCGGRCRVDTKHGERPIRLAWFERDGGLICFDYQEPEIAVHLSVDGEARDVSVRR